MEKSDQVDDILNKACDAIDQDTLERNAKTCAGHALSTHSRTRPPKLDSLRESNGVQNIDLSHFNELEENMLTQSMSAKKIKTG